MKTPAALVCVAWLCAGCSSSVSPPDGDLGFPLAVGSVWTYAVYDSVAGAGDSVEVSLTREVSSTASCTVYLWRMRGRSGSDSLYLIRAGDTLSFCLTPQGDYPSPVFVFPFRVGGGWRWPGADSFTVTAIESIATPAGIFRSCYRIENRPFIGNFYGGTTYWLAPDVGIVRKEERWLDTVTMERRNITWQLLSYRLGRWGPAGWADPMHWMNR